MTFFFFDVSFLPYWYVLRPADVDVAAAHALFVDFLSAVAEIVVAIVVTDLR